jgi:hypothetical protein
MAASNRAEGSHTGDDGRVPTALLSFPSSTATQLRVDFRFGASVSWNVASTAVGRCSSSARSREVGVVTEMLLTNSEQVSDDGPAPPDYA